MKDRFRIRVGGIAFIDNKLLLITHIKNNKEYWVVPGGRVEFGESADQTLIREFKEELNIDIEINSFLFYNESLPPDYPVHTLNLFFLVKPLATDITLGKDPIIGKFDFFEKNQINNILLYPKINNIVHKEFDKWLEKIS